MASINVSDVRRVSVAFTNAAGTAADPTAVLLYVKKPGQASFTTYTYGADVAVVKDSTGNYHMDLTLDTAGRWRFEWVGTGAVVASEEDTFTVSPQRTRG